MEQKPLVIIYRNHRGEIARRRIIPLSVFFGKSQYHAADSEHWFMVAEDLGKKAARTFKMIDILQIEDPRNCVGTGQ